MVTRMGHTGSRRRPVSRLVRVVGIILGLFDDQLLPFSFEDYLELADTVWRTIRFAYATGRPESTVAHAAKRQTKYLRGMKPPQAMYSQHHAGR